MHGAASAGYVGHWRSGAKQSIVVPEVMRVVVRESTVAALFPSQDPSASRRRQKADSNTSISHFFHRTMRGLPSKGRKYE